MTYFAHGVRVANPPQTALTPCFTCVMLCCAINQTVTFGDYRRPSLVERAAITVAGVFPIAWGAVRVFRGMRRNWAKGVVAVVAPVLAWLMHTLLTYLYK